MVFKWDNCIKGGTLNTSKLFKYVEKHGSNATDTIGFRLYNYLYLMSKNHLEILINIHKCNCITDDGYIFYVGYHDAICTYIIKLLLENDSHDIYLTTKVKCNTHIYANLLRYLIAMEINFRDYVSLNPQKYYCIHNRIVNQIDLVRNHRNKKITLFMLMLPQID